MSTVTVTVTIRGTKITSTTRVINSRYDATRVEEINFTSVDGKRIRVVECFGDYEFLSNGERIAYVDGRIGYCHPDPKMMRATRRRARVELQRLFRSLSGVGLDETEREIDRAREHYYRDPMGCIEDYE